MTSTYQNRIQKFIKNQPIVTVRYEESYVKVKWLKGLNITAKVSKNLYNEEFFNGDICEVLAELNNDYLWISRVADDHQKLVEKKYLKIAAWEACDF